GDDYGLDSNEDEVVAKVEEVSLVDGVFDGAFGGDGDDDFVMGEGVVVPSSSFVKSIKSCLEKCGKDDEEHGEGNYLTRINMIKEDERRMVDRRRMKRK
nr:hypothetical protein [Tanacetum cinerariifolium]